LITDIKNMGASASSLPTEEGEKDKKIAEL
jgi:hypothetical protein